jgi:hypothetical protein
MYPDDEVSKVRTPKDAWNKLEKLDRVLNRMVVPIQQIPEIAEKVSEIGERVAKVEERVASTKDRVDGLDHQVRRPHDCFQVDNIERVEVSTLSLRKDVEDDTRKLGLVSADVDYIKTNVKAAKAVKRSNHYYWIGIATSFLLAGAAAVWYMRGVSAEIQMEAMARDAQFKQVEVVLTKVSQQSDTEPVVQQIKQLKTSVEQGNDDYDNLCVGMPEDQKARVRQALVGKQLPPSCGG